MNGKVYHNSRIGIPEIADLNVELGHFSSDLFSSGWFTVESERVGLGSQGRRGR